MALFINEIAAISRKSRDDGTQYWGRIAGTAYERMTNEWTAAQFRRIGLEQVRIRGPHSRCSTRLRPTERSVWSRSSARSMGLTFAIFAVAR
jgi:hypothetical protein